MDAAGQLLIHIRVGGGQVREVTSQVRRPPAAALLVGRPVDQAEGLIPALYSLCGRAQGLAARAALEAAEGRLVDPVQISHHSRRVVAEAVQEHLWRLLLDWPNALGLPVGREAFAVWYKRMGAAAGSEGEWSALANGLEAWMDAHLLGGEAVRWTGARHLANIPETGVCAEAVRALANDAYRCPTPGQPVCVPSVCAADCAKALHGLGAEGPEWRGAPAETGALSAHTEHPLIRALFEDGWRIAARYLARVLALVTAANALRAPSEAPVLSAACLGEGCGIARVETARGALLHWAEVEQGRVCQYRVLAPTEWNFHPRGAFGDELKGVRGSGAALRARVGAAVLSLDPCVPWRLEVSENA